MAKQVTLSQAERKKAQAAAFMDRIGEPDRADEFDSMSAEEYAEQRGLELVINPKRKARKTTMAAGPTKTELQETIDSALETLNEAYTPEASREELATAIGAALDVLNGETDDEEDDSDEEDDDEGE